MNRRRRWLYPDVRSHNVCGLVRLARLPEGGGAITSLAWNPGTLLLIRFWDDNHSGTDTGNAIDNLRFQAVPEPAKMVALAIGVGAILRRRKR